MFERGNHGVHATAIACLTVCGTLLTAGDVFADGHVKGPVGYEGSLEEKSQEAIIILHGSAQTGQAHEEMILKIAVAGNTDTFAWIIPFPNQPTVTPADAKLFKELYDYVRHRLRLDEKTPKGKKGFGGGGFGGATGGVEVLSRELVGSYDVATVREHEPGALNNWLIEEGYQYIDNGDDVIDEYREKGYVFCCIKVSEAHVSDGSETNLHPLRFSFRTGGRDSVYFPMKLTGLQEKMFDVNLYVFTSKQLNDRHGPFGYERRGFRTSFSDSWRTRPIPRRGPSSVKSRTPGRPVWSDGAQDAYLSDVADKIPTVTQLFRDLYPGQRFILTKLHARHLQPSEVRNWDNDLWLFPRFASRKAIPLDARPGGPAHVKHAAE